MTLGIDLGTSSVKVVAVDRENLLVGSGDDGPTASCPFDDTIDRIRHHAD